MTPSVSEIEQLRSERDRARAEVMSLQAELSILRAISNQFKETTNEYLAAIAAPPRAARSLGGLLAFSLSAIWRRWKLAKAQIEAIAKAQVFDAAWYLKRYPDVEEAGIDPLLHYIRHGASEGRDPNPLFDSNWYRSRYSDVKLSGITPLGHFALIGAEKHYDPNPLFHTAWYIVHNPDVYEKKLNPLRHYMQYGAEPGRNPNPLFDSAWYLSKNGDVRDAGENPLAHYIHHGIRESRNPHPLFDSQWYLKQYEHVSMAGIDALEHYLTIGAFEGCRPGPLANDRALAEARLGGEDSSQYTGSPERASAMVRRTETRAGVCDPVNVMAWRMKLNRHANDSPVFTGQIGVFLHLFYEGLAEEFAARLSVIPFDFKVYISTNNKEKQRSIAVAFRARGIEPIIKIVKNRGWDVAPFLLSFGDEIRNHEICLKLHGKSSIHGQRGSEWRQFLMSGLVGDSRNVIDIVGHFTAHSKLGVLMLPHWPDVARRAHIIGVNYMHMRALLGRVGLSILASQKIEFPSGSMFWFRSEALTSLLDLGLTWNDFDDCKPRSVDATIAHAIERSILIFSAKAGFNWAYHPHRKPRLSWLPSFRPKREGYIADLN